MSVCSTLTNNVIDPLLVLHVFWFAIPSTLSSILQLLCPPPHRAEALSGDARLTSDDYCLSRTSGLENREAYRKTKIGTEVGHVTRDSNTTFKVKRSKVKLQGRGILCGLRTACYNARSLAAQCNVIGPVLFVCAYGGCLCVGLLPR